MSISDERYSADKKECEKKSFQTPREYTSLPRKTMFGINDREPSVIKVDSLYELGVHALNGGDTKKKPAWNLLMKVSEEISQCLLQKGWKYSPSPQEPKI